MKMRFSSCATAICATLLVLAHAPLRPSAAGLPATAPPAAGQRPSAGAVVSVSSEPELQAAVARVTSGTTIVIAPGTYRLTATLVVPNGLSDVTIRGASDNSGDVVLVGRGMANPEFESVPHGILIAGRTERVTIANLTISEVFHHAIQVEAGARAPRFHNLNLANAGRQFIKVLGANGSGTSEGVLENSVIGYTATSRDGDTNGIEVAAGSRWTIRRNVFRHIEAPRGLAAGPAVLLWQGSRDSVVEGNLFLNCQREIALGLEDRTPNDHTGGIVRNNFIYRDSGLQGDTAIVVADSPRAQVLHNTVLVNGSAAAAIEYRFRDAAGVVVRNNLLDAPVAARDRATGIARDNYTQAQPWMFVNAAVGDLHLTSTAVAVFDQVPVIREAMTDFDSEARAEGSLVDYGADEVHGPPVQNGPLPAPAPSQPAAPQTTTTTSTTTSNTRTASSVTMSSANVDPASTLPSPWETFDIGNTRSGSASYASETFTLYGGGSDIGGNNDQFRFTYQPLEGDGEIVARVESIERTHPWAKAGIMFREELTSGSKYAGVLVTAEKGVMFQRRIAQGATTTTTAAGSERSPVWLKVTRAGDVFTAYKSSDGAQWTVVGTETVYLNQTVHVGLAVTSRSTRTMAKGVFTKVSVSQSGTNQMPTVAIVTPSAGSTFTSSDSIQVDASAADPDGAVSRVDFYAGSTMIGTKTSSPFRVIWTNAPAGRHVLKAIAHDDKGASASSPPVEVEIASPVNKAPTVTITAPSNGASYTAPASITIAASASDADGSIVSVDFLAGSRIIASDSTSPYSANWTSVPEGTYTLTAVARDNEGATSGAAPITITVVGAPANQPPTVSLTAPASGATFTAPATVSLAAQAADSDGSITKVEFFAGSTLIGSDTTSPYTATWAAQAGTHSLSAKAYDNSGSATISAAINITVNAGSTLPPEWQTKDIGSPAIAGSAGFSADVFTVAGAGTDIWNNADQFRFVYQPFDGDGTIQACVTGLDFVDEWTKAGVMFRETLDAGSPHAMALLSAGRGAIYQHRTTPGGTSALSGTTAAVAPHCVRLVRKGSLFTAYQSVDGAAWSVLGTQTIQMNAAGYVGLAVTSRDHTKAASARYERVAIAQAAPNQPPQVALTAPSAGATFAAGSTITLAASASDTDGAIAKVDFYAGATLVGSDSSSPFSATWSGAPSGTHALKAVAWDDSGASATSSTVSVTVNSNQAPSVSLTLPTSGASFTAPATITFGANASDSDGTIAVVEFQLLGVTVASDSSAPYSASVSGIPEGTYTVTAVARDNAGATTTSAAVSITVAPGATPLPKQLVFTASADHSTLVTSYVVEAFTAGSNASGTPFRTLSVGKPTPVNGEITVDVSAFIQGLPAGSYFLTVSAVGSAGSARSAPTETFAR